MPCLWQQSSPEALEEGDTHLGTSPVHCVGFQIPSQWLIGVLSAKQQLLKCFGFLLTFLIPSKLGSTGRVEAVQSSVADTFKSDHSLFGCKEQGSAEDEPELKCQH